MLFLCFFFKQKTAYEMRISDWSSDVCSSDLHDGEHKVGGDHVVLAAHRGASPSLCTQSLPASRHRLSARARASSEPANHRCVPITIAHSGGSMQIGRATCVERACLYV